MIALAIQVLADSEVAKLSAVDMKNGTKKLKHTMDIHVGDYTSEKFTSAHHKAYQISLPEGMSLTLFRSLDFTGDSRSYEGPKTITIPNERGDWSAQVRKSVDMKQINEDAPKAPAVVPPLPQVRSGDFKVVNEWVMVVEGLGDLSYITKPGFSKSKNADETRVIYEDFKNAAKLGNFYFRNHNDNSLEHIPAPQSLTLFDEIGGLMIENKSLKQTEIQCPSKGGKARIFQLRYTLDESTQFLTEHLMCQPEEMPQPQCPLLFCLDTYCQTCLQYPDGKQPFHGADRKSVV